MSSNSDHDPCELADSLLTGFAFVYENPDSPEPLTAYRSPFILRLLATAHLNAINGFVQVSALGTQELAVTGMMRVIALSAAAVERALGLIKDKHIKVQDLLSSASKGKLAIKLPKVLSKATGKETNAPFLFSSANWSSKTRGFIGSIDKKPAGYVEMTVKIARATLTMNTETPLGSLVEELDERALICEYMIAKMMHY
ncbi:hypothetical protein AZE42_08950 [Rhizopogon vesiculosus]|uniref:Uncharacterized protein n=1 Tax=Rhizopogon vesiculosus TaxID=180088 RepID=A0A1J8QAF8_9AGAM|nr:hypothetical protein AZE42_08950 [Rhizopogon vesiculosus]